MKFFAAARGWVCRKLLIFVAWAEPKLFLAITQEKAAELSTEVTMAYLAREGIMTCCKCPRRAPLVKAAKNVYACPVHAAEVVAMFNNKPAPVAA